MTTYAQRVERIQPSLTLKINAEAAAMERGGEHVARLGAGEPDFDTPEPIKQAAHEAIDAGYTKYTAVAGFPELRQAVREKFRRDNALEFDDDQVVVTNGAKQALYDVCQTLLRPGDQAVIPRPYWITYPAQVHLAEAEPVFIDAPMEEHFSISPDRLDAALNERTRLLFINSPNNPSGRVYRRVELEAIAEVLRSYPDVYVISDDIYEHINWSSEPFRNLLNVAPDLADRTLVVNGVSKAYAMTGWRIGFVAGPKAVMAEVGKVQGQSTAGAATISQHAAHAALTGDQQVVKDMVAEFRRRHDHIVPALNELPGVECRTSDGTFYSFPDVRELIERTDGIKDDTELAERLLKDVDVAVVPGSGFGMPGHIRVSYAAGMDTIDTALERLKKFTR